VERDYGKLERELLLLYLYVYVSSIVIHSKSLLKGVIHELFIALGLVHEGKLVYYLNYG